MVPQGLRYLDIHIFEKMIIIIYYNDMIFIHLRRRFKLEFTDNALDSVDTGPDNFLVHFDHLQWPIIIIIIMIIVIIIKTGLLP